MRKILPGFNPPSRNSQIVRSGGVKTLFRFGRISALTKRIIEISRPLDFGSFNNNGQAVLIILLIVSVILVIGLSVASRSITDIKTSQQTEESARVFWVAQAGLEKAIKADSNLSTQQLNNIDYSVSKSVLGGGSSFTFDESTLGKVSADEVKTFWLINHNADGSFGSAYSGSIANICWDIASSSDTPAIELTVLYKEGATFKFKRYVYDPNNVRVGTNKFSLADQTCSQDSSLKYSIKSSDLPITLTGSPYFIWIKMLYLDPSRQVPVKIFADAGNNFPDQGSCFESTAKISVSSITRKLMECRSWPTPPTIFSYLLFSGQGGINKP